MSLRCVVVLKDTSSVTGEIKDKKINIKTSFGPMGIATKNIVHIHIKNPPQFLNDEMLLKSGDKLIGEITDKAITIKPDSSKDTLNIEKSKIHTILFLVV